jgi:hypothetical protein
VKKRLAIVDTSILCVWLRVPGVETCGEWDYVKVKGLIDGKLADNVGLVLPYPTLVEVGNHIANAPSHRFDAAKRFSDLAKEAVSGNRPWTVFSRQLDLLDDQRLRHILDQFPGNAAKGISLADVAILSVASFYRGLGYQVEVLTGDENLAALAS